LIEMSQVCSFLRVHAAAIVGAEKSSESRRRGALLDAMDHAFLCADVRLSRVLELTVVRWLGWRMNFGNDQIFLLVIWVLGVSMIALITYYTLLPWTFVMAAGYCFGRVLELEPTARRRLLFRLGGVLVAAFVLLRWTNAYGDPSPWMPQPSGVLTAASFVNSTKYPPSLLYLLMTLAPALILLACIERVRLASTNPLLVFGRVPLSYYLLHVPLIHALAIVFGAVEYGRVDFLLRNPPAILGAREGFPTDYGYNLVVVYVVWLAVVALLYPACRWFAALKQRSRSPALSYL
jgi:uncharacterized membrane protein